MGYWDRVQAEDAKDRRIERLEHVLLRCADVDQEQRDDLQK
jgi:hypothetical protein